MGAVTATTRFGKSDLSVFLKVFSGMVATSYARKTATDGLILKRTIQHGSSVQWPMVGSAKAVYHTVNENIITDTTGSKYLSDPGAGERVVQVDNPLVAAEVIASIDEAMSHFEIRSHHAAALGEALAIENDLNVLMCVCNGAAKSALLSGTGAGSWADEGDEVVDADFHTSASSARDTLKSIAQKMNENDVPQDGRVAIVTPGCYAALADDVSGIANADINMNTGGDVGLHRVLRVHGFEIRMSNRIADLQGYDTDYASSAKTGQRGTDYTYADFSKVSAVVFQKSAIGQVELGSMALKAEEKPELLGTFFIASKTVGNGVLRPSACFVVKNAA
tara:strand:- start:7639 stop:8643 length:1005 start_codon:yes stop_codon:yes gene_type:complete